MSVGTDAGEAAVGASRQDVQKVGAFAVRVSFFLSGTAALIYEVAWTRELGLVFGSTVYAVSMMLAAFMSGLTFGAVLGGRWSDKPQRDLIALLAKLEFGIGAFALLTTPLIRSMPASYYWISEKLAPPLLLFFVIQLIFSFGVMIVPTTLMGATFPVVSKVAVRSYSRLGQLVGGVYSINTLGSVAGSILAGFVMIPFIGVENTIIAAASLNLTASCFLMWMDKRPTRLMWTVAAIVVVILGWGVAKLTPAPSFVLGMESFGRYQSFDHYLSDMKMSKVLYSKDDAYGRVVVTTDAQDVRTLHHGGLIEGSNLPVDKATTGLLAALPYAYARDSKSVAVVGLGTGYTTLAALRLPVERVETIEINGHMDEAASFFVGDELSSDPRWRLAVDDARARLAYNSRRYDIITSEPSWPISSSVANLFSQEFFGIAKQRLTDGGVMCQWLPGYLLSDDDLLMMYKTFASVFPQVEIWGLDDPSMEASEIFLIGVNGSAKPTAEEVQGYVEEYLDSNGLEQIEVAKYEVTDEMAEMIRDDDVPLNTDDHPRLQFSIAAGLVEQFRFRSATMQ